MKYSIDNLEKEDVLLRELINTITNGNLENINFDINKLKQELTQ
jgi:hypothetical protein